MFQAVAERFGYKVGVTKQKMKILSCLVGSRLPGMLTLNQHEAQVHVVDMKSINFNVSTVITKNHYKKFNSLYAFGTNIFDQRS